MKFAKSYRLNFLAMTYFWKTLLNLHASKGRLKIFVLQNTPLIQNTIPSSLDTFNLDSQKCHVLFLMFFFQVKEMLYCGYASRLCGARGPVPEKTHGQEQIKWYVNIYFLSAINNNLALLKPTNFSSPFFKKSLIFIIFHLNLQVTVKPVLPLYHHCRTLEAATTGI